MLQRLPLFIGLLFMMAGPLRAQQKPVWQEIADRPVQEKCVTVQMDSALRARFPEMGTRDSYERTLQQEITRIQQLRRTGRLQAAVVTIPVVVHIVHNGEAVGTGRNLSAAQVQSQLETLNEDYRRKVGTRGYNTNAVGADIEIEFCLAAVNPQGGAMAEKGIDRINGNRATWSRSEVESVLKPTTFWDPEKYFNIWVTELVESAGGSTIVVAYAQFPSQSNLAGMNANSGPASTDGVVVNYWAFGNAEKGNFPGLRAPYNLGRTLTHETGHWLGLIHIWGDANCGNDFVDDTPSQASESRGCPKGRVSCGSINMVENYMDYSDDACMNIFTQGQKDRMRAVMNVSPRRANLPGTNICGTTVVARPGANFRADKQRILLGASVRFTDLSTNFPTRWEWTFEGGSPSTSTDQNPTVTYTQAGKFKVTLVATNNAGSSSPTVKEQYIEVINAGLCSDQTNFNGTPTVIRQPNGTGYVGGQNSTRSQAVSELFDNQLGYSNLSGASLRFGVAKAARGAQTDAVVTVTVWNGRGFQGGPGSVLESKDVPLRSILEDVANNRSTAVTFDRNVPVGGLPFHIGVELTYATGDTVALISTRDGESLNSTSWRRSAQGNWGRVRDSLGLNIAFNISARQGMKPSVQIATSEQIIDPGEAVTLSARGASIFTWSGANLSSTLGAQVVARPTQTTTYTVRGSGLDLCDTLASARIIVRPGTITSVPTTPDVVPLAVTPNPSDGLAKVSFRNSLRGATIITILNTSGVEILKQQVSKTDDAFERTLDLHTQPPGLYIVEVRIGEQVFRQKLLKF